MEKNRVCPICGTSFIAFVKNTKYCCDRCRNIASNKWNKENKGKKKKKKKRTFSDTLLEVKESGMSYAEYQKQKTLEIIPKIDTNI